jgi:hypothetical protein
MINKRSCILCVIFCSQKSKHLKVRPHFLALKVSVPLFISCFRHYLLFKRVILLNISKKILHSHNHYKFTQLQKIICDNKLYQHWWTLPADINLVSFALF